MSKTTKNTQKTNTYEIEDQNGEKITVSEFSWDYAMYIGENGEKNEIEALLDLHEEAHDRAKDLHEKNLVRLAKLRAGYEQVDPNSLRGQALKKQVEYWEDKSEKDYSEHHFNCIGLLMGKMIEREL